jgi:hypothetical protein
MNWNITQKKTMKAPIASDADSTYSVVIGVVLMLVMSLLQVSGFLK